MRKKIFKQFSGVKNISSRNIEGFTLVELMVAMAMSGILIAAVYSAYVVQQKSYYTQSQVVDMQQNIRASLELLSSDLRMAGYDPDKSKKAEFASANIGSVRFSMDLNKDGDVNDDGEDLTYKINNDNNNDGISDTGRGELVRIDNNLNNTDTIAEDIQAIEFYYHGDPGNANFPSVSPAKLDDIRMVQITIIAVAKLQDPKYSNDEIYVTPSNNDDWQKTGFSDDNYRRRMLTTSVNIRNLGLDYAYSSN